MRSTTLRGAIVCVLLALPGSALAGDAREESRAAFRRGVQQLEASEYSSARDSFAEAYRLFPHPSILLNLGIARAHTGELLEAEQDLIRFLADDGGAPPNEIASAHAELAEVRKHLGTLRLRVSPNGAMARVDARAVALIPGKFVDVRAITGSHSVHVEADGYEPVERTVVIDNANVVAVDLALKPIAVAGVAGPRVDAAEADASGRRTVGVSLLGGGVVVAGLGIASGLHAQSLADAYNTPNSGAFQDASTKSTGILFRTLADVAFGVAIVAGASGIYLLATDGPPPNGSSARVVVGPSFSGIVGRF